MRALATCLVIIASSTAALAQQTGDDAPRVIYSNVSVIDIHDGSLHEEMAIVVRDGRIEAVIPALDAAPEEPDEVVDGTGWFAMPGMIDSHVHVATVPARDVVAALFKRHIYGGVTTVRDMAGDARALADLARAALVQEIPAPNLEYSALMAAPSFFTDPRTVASAMGETPGEVPWMQAITDDTDIPLAVATARGTSASGIKIYANLSDHLVRSVIAEASRQDFPVWTHAKVYPAPPLASIEGGATAISHVCMLADHAVEPGRDAYRRDKSNTDNLDYSTVTPEHPLISEVVDAMLAEGTVLDATLSVYESADKRVAEQGTTPAGCGLKLASEITAYAAGRGVRIAAGTDVQAAADEVFPSLYRELELLTGNAGLTALQTLQAATINGAAALDLEDEIGSIENGKRANLVFMTANPLDDIANLRTLVLTVKQGKPFYRSEYQHEPIPDIPFPD